jgi:hypothetical protein
MATKKTTTSPLANGGKPGPEAPVIDETKTNTPAEPAKTETAEPYGVSGGELNSGASAGGGTYEMVKGRLTYQGQDYSGEYQGKYYNQGKELTPAEVKQQFLSQYAEQAKFIQSVPELSNLLDKAIANNWSSTEWATQFAGSQWAQAHPGNIGLAEIQRISTPEQYNLNYNQAYDKASTLASQLGIQLTPNQLGKKIDSSAIGQVQNVDQDAINKGQDITNWILQNPNASDQQIQQRMAQYGTLNPQALGGTIKAQSNALQTLAEQYGVLGQYAPAGTSGAGTNYFDQYALKMAAGAAGYDQNTAGQQFKTAAMATYKPYAEQIANGAKVSDLASPYINTLSSLLEVDPSNIQLGSATGYGAMISKAMMGDANGQPINPYDFASQVRSQPEWLNTQNAHQTILGGVDQLIQKMGLG